MASLPPQISYLDAIALSTGATVFGGTHDVLTHSTLIDNTSSFSNLLFINTTAGSSKLISGNTFLQSGSAYDAISYSGGAAAVTDQVVGNTITDNTALAGEVSATVDSGLDLLALEILFASSPEFFTNG